ncbi:carboxypeptidase-like regulatory domain-containing protein [Spirosoma sp. SC4-14]|uniref:carboxypeptidase-like regulatory domain-containing protein n=1 Tax=Spirosoma sp. SC4-14 TaxID=3128900 RepID=UPI0030CDE431
MNYCITLLLWVTACSGLYAQTGKLSGRVIDSSTQQPLPFANVYLNNTTIGATTNANGEFLLQHLPLGSADIVVSFIGYVSQQLKVMVRETGNTPVAIRLNPDAQQLVEVGVKSNRDKDWERQFKRFEKVFLGNTATCKIINPWIIDFGSGNGQTTATALVLLEIENKQLGYKLYFQLKKFAYSSTTFAIVGNVRFTELDASGTSQAAAWTKNRERAYHGSVKHLMKAILDRRLKQQGFLLYGDKTKGRGRSNNFSAELEYNLVPYDTSSLAVSAAGLNEYRLSIKDRLEIHYLNDFTNRGFYKDISHPVSWLDVRGGYVVVNKEGTMLNPTDVAVSGSMADARVSGMLPLNYQPGNPVVTKAPTNFLVRRLQEKAYLHTDKPYYYPGDKLWFSAFMNYRIPGLRDTLSKVLYVDLIDSERQLAQQCVLKINSGRAASAFRLPVPIKPGKYVLRAYTQWMRNYGIANFFYKPITILALNEQVDAVAPKPVADSLLTVGVDRAGYKKRDKVSMTLRFDTTGLTERINGSFSVAVFDEAVAVPIVGPTSIKTSFDLPEPPGDLPFRYAIEKGVSISGLYKDKKGRTKKTVLMLIPEHFDQFYSINTLNNGEFSLPNLVFYDSTKFVIQPEGSVILSDRVAPLLPDKLPEFPMRIVSANTLHPVYSGDTLQAKLLQTVSVSARKLVRSESAYGTPDVYLKGENLEGYASMADAIAAKLPTFKLIYDQTNWFLIWGRASVPTGSNLSGQSNLSSHEPSLYINNVLVVGESTGDRLMQLSPSMIDHIEVNGMITSNQGANGSNGLINVYTKRPAEASSKPVSFVKARGFDQEITFQSPDYTRPVENAAMSDYRSTLYWNPRVAVSSEQGATNLSFFTGDVSGSYRVVVEGITSSGNTVRAEAVFTVNP